MKAERKRNVVPVPALLACVLISGMLGIGCRQDMHDQAKYEPLEASDLFPDGMASRRPVPNTVARGHLREDVAYYTGRAEDQSYLASFPMERLREAVEKEEWRISAPDSKSGFTRAVLLRGQQRYEIFCVHCHGSTGAGNGMIVQRGFKQPESYHSERLRAVEPGYLVNVMTEGFGQMSSYAAQVKIEDRWAIAAYIQALQLSQSARDGDLSPDDRRRLEEGPADHGDDGHGDENQHEDGAHAGAK